MIDNKKDVRTVVRETTAAQALRVTEGSTGYDEACKRVLSEKAILARIMKACLEEYKDCDVDDIAEKYIEGQPQISSVPVLPDEGGTIITGMDTEDKSSREGTFTYDIRFRAIAPGDGGWIALIINLEAQNDFYPGYPLLKRGVFYCSREISSQYGREFTGSHYEKIKKVYSIWICMDPPKYRANTITRYRMAEENLVGEAAEPVENYDLLSVIMICLGGADRENYGGILRMLDVLLSNENSAAEKRKILQEDYGIAMTEKLDQEVADVCNLSKGIMEKGIAQGMKKGMEMGKAQGKAEGKAEGKAQTLMSSIKNLVESLGMSAAQAMAALKIPEDEQQKYMDMLEKGSRRPQA